MSTRALDVHDLPHGRSVGTIHRPETRSSDVGLLWVNFGYVLRAGHGRLASQTSAHSHRARRSTACTESRVPCASGNEA
jgi:hypothetical protein